MKFVRIETLALTVSSLMSRRSLVTIIGSLLAWGAIHSGEEETAAKREKKRRTIQKRRKKRRRRDDDNQPPPPPAPVVRVDARCFGSSDVDFGASENSRLAQTFVALSSGQLVRAEIPVDKFENAVDEWILRLSPVDAAGLPTNEILADSVVPDANVPLGDATVVAFEFASPFSVVSGTAYALVLTRGEFFFWSKRDGDNCPGSAFFSSDQIDPFIETDGEFVYTTFVAS